MKLIRDSLALLLLLPVLACAGLLTQGTHSATTSGGGGGEAFGAYLDMDLSVDPTYRIDMSVQDYPTFLTAGATHTYEATGCWDGGPAAKLTPPVSGGTDGYSALGGWQINNSDTLAIHELNVRWEASFGSTFITNWAEGADMKWVIVHSRPALGDTSTNQRPMVNWQKPTGNNVFAIAVGAGTFKQFDPAPGADPQFGPDINLADFFLGPTTTTLSDEPVIGADTWLTFELQVIAESQVGATDGRIRIVVTDRDGTTLTDFQITWFYDSNWTLPRFIDEVQVIGGFYNELYASSDANTYQRICGVTFAVDNAGVLGPRSGFVQ
jgi:hypothetical protein